MAMYPTIIIPGIGQSRVKTVDAAGNVNGSIWPIDIDFKGILDDVKKSLMKMMKGIMMRIMTTKSMMKKRMRKKSPKMETIRADFRWNSLSEFLLP